MTRWTEKGRLSILESRSSLRLSVARIYCFRYSEKYRSNRLEHDRMITCYLRYEVNPDKLTDFEAYGAMWLDLVPRFGGIHHGYFLPSEGDSDIALAMFSFPSLAAYEQYRKDAAADPDVQKAVAFAKETRCFTRYERSFFRPLLPKAA